MRQEQTDPAPLTWETPAAALSAAAVLAGWVLPVGQALAYLVARGRPVWPHNHVLEAVVGLARGRPGTGLPPQSGQAPTWLVYGCIGLVEIVLLLVLVCCASAWRHRVSGAAGTGLASRAEIAGVLGHRSLQRRRAVIRPDLVGRRGSTRWWR